MPGRITPPMPDRSLAVGEHGVDERGRRVARRRMHRHPGRLVDHEQVAVFVDDVERDRLRLRDAIGVGAGTRRDTLWPGFEPQAGLRRRTVDLDVSVVDQPSHTRAREPGQPARDEHVEPLAGSIRA